MSGARYAALTGGFILLLTLANDTKSTWAHDACASSAEADEFSPPPGDPWYAPQPPQRGQRRSAGLVLNERITPHWDRESKHFWYRRELRDGAKEFIRVDAERGTRDTAFDHKKLARSLSDAVGSHEYRADRLPFEEITFADDLKTVRFVVGETAWTCDLETYRCSKTKDDPAPKRGDESGGPPQRSRPRRGGAGFAQGRDRLRSPDGKWTALLKDHNVYLQAEGKTDAQPLSTDGKDGLAYGRLAWAPDSKTLVAYRIDPGERKEVYLVQSSPPGGGRAKLQSRPYPLPGDKFTVYELNLFHIADKSQTKPDIDRIDYDSPQLRWRSDGHRFTYEKTDRGHQRFRLIEVDTQTGKARTLVGETSATFIWEAHREGVNLDTVTWLEKSDEIIYASERDGWRHLTLIDSETGQIKNAITHGSYVVRGIERIDEENRQVWFRASGREPDQDPYFMHFYRVNFDGTGLVALTEGNGTHAVQLSPDRKYLIDTYSRVDRAPVHELRRTSDGSRVCALEDADISALEASGWKAPEVFVAKGRDGKTDIWGILCRPRNVDPNAKYPVIEQIYAGPQGSFVPKSFSPFRRFAALTDLGFVVVQMDGMGTANRSKAFHDVCWHNLKDAGFPDRILWHKAAAKKYAWYDLTRVGITGTSAGGQNATAGVLFHPEFYHAAVSACGCHDNRMDKASWNEQWMGYPVGPWYAESSNIENAHRLRGKLMLIVGEMDTNVPPESTLRLADALIKAGKDFELVVVPNAGHGMGGSYGQRRMEDFFVRNLLGREPSDRNENRPRDTETTRAAAERSDAPGRVERSASALDLHDLNSDQSALRGVIERYDVDRGSFFRSLPPAISPERDARVREFTRNWLTMIETLDFDNLSRDGQVDFMLFKNHLDHDLRVLEIREREREEAAPLVPFTRTILDLDRARRAIEAMDWSKVASDLNGLTKEVGDARRNRERTPRADDKIKRAAANRAVSTVDDLRNTLSNWFRFYDGYDPMFTWWNSEPYKAADEALRGYAAFLRERFGMRPAPPEEPGTGPPRRRVGRDDAPAGAREGGRDIVGNPIGRAALISELTYERVPYTPEELIRIAEDELAWCEAALKKAARAMGLGDDWRAALERVKTRYVEPGKQPRLIRDLALEAIDYLDAHDLVTVPPLCRDSWRMGMMSPERQLVNPFFTGGETISVSFPTSGMSHEAKLMSMRGNNIHFARATVFHEVIPGHHMQSYMSARYRTYRRLFETPFSVEGWALYWELLLWDRGFARSPEDEIGMLFWRSHRCARIIFSLKFHLEQMTAQECIAFLVDRVGHERDNATAEVRRSFATSYGPLYQAAYLLGGLQFRALHRELVESRKMSDRAFHDAILRENQIPVEMVRALLTGQTLTRDQPPSWRFQELPKPRE